MIGACELAPAYIRAIAPYQPGKPVSELAREMGLDEAAIVKLASNENPRGCSALARAALERGTHDLARYPDGSGFDLKQALARRLKVDAGQIVLGSGSNDVLDLVARAFLSGSTSSVYSQHAFAVYPLATQAAGATGIEVRARDFGHDLEAMAAAVRDDTRVLWIANPNNPTGTFALAPAVRALLERVPREVIVVLDEAYKEYLSDDLQVDTVPWLAAFPNLVITRTFSKAYGLAGLRVGFGLAHPDVIGMLERVRLPFNVGSLAQAAAVAALGDQDFVERSRQLNADGLRQIERELTRLAVDYVPSRGNFLSCRVGEADEVYRRLLAQGVIVRPIRAYGLPHHLRVTVGLESENARFLSALQRALHA
jgi:histidinol-phosphate aminotransferase